ncbi:hypothetical protein [Soonwooa sp.]|uniref:hypothetical protein n=1 Tax=Soonwooa sp. TaxID=1938592 RepID=UPI0028A96914|nr:hypothetical protein [Soonwooa sp.]
MKWDDKVSILAQMEAASFVGWREAAQRKRSRPSATSQRYSGQRESIFYVSPIFLAPKKRKTSGILKF